GYPLDPRLEAETARRLAEVDDRSHHIRECGWIVRGELESVFVDHQLKTVDRCSLSVDLAQRPGSEMDTTGGDTESTLIDLNRHPAGFELRPLKSSGELCHCPYESSPYWRSRVRENVPGLPRQPGAD